MYFWNIKVYFWVLVLSYCLNLKSLKTFTLWVKWRSPKPFWTLNSPESYVHDLHCNFISELSCRLLPPDLSLASEVSWNRLRKNCVRAETGHDGWCRFELGEVYSLIETGFLRELYGRFWAKWFGRTRASAIGGTPRFSLHPFWLAS